VSTSQEVQPGEVVDTVDTSTPEGAAVYEQRIADEAKALRQGADRLTPELLEALYPLLARPIPSAYIKTTGVVKGKPYESTGVRSVQVQVDRMNNVLTPAWWWDEVEYFEDGKLCAVTVCIGIAPELGHAVVRRKSYGGVGQASNLGNLYKGS
jgi:hypothetical protein